MSATTPQTAAPPFQHRWYQFTLREMLLASLAFCLLCALFAGQRHSTTTSFCDSFSPDQAIKAVVDAGARLGLQVRYTGGGNGSGCISSSGICDFDLNFDSPPASQSEKVVWELREEIARLLEKHGCEIQGADYSGQPGAVVRFSFAYSKGGTAGYVWVHSANCPDNKWRLFILIHESVRYGPIGR